MLSPVRNGLGIIQDKVKSVGITSASSTEVKLEKGYLNGINLSLQTGVGASTITVKYTPKNGKPIYQLQNFPLVYLQMLSDQKNGHSLPTTKVIQELSNGYQSIVDDGTVAGLTALSQAIQDFAGRTYKTSIDIPLGNLYLDPQRLEIEINWKYSDAPVNRTAHISRYITDKASFELLRYSISKEESKTFTEVREIYALATANYGTDKDVFFQVSDRFSNQDDSWEGFHQSTLVNGRYESAPIGEVPVKIYGTTDILPQNVEVELTGSETNEVELLTIQEEIIPEELDNSQVNSVQALAVELQSIEQQDPKKAAAYRKKYNLPSSGKLFDVIKKRG